MTQQNLYSKDENAPPTVYNDTLIMTFFIYVWGNRDVASADVNGAYSHTTMNDFTTRKLEGEAADVISKVNIQNEKCVCWKRVKEVMYIHLLKTVYGYVKSALLWYELFSSILYDSGLKLNPYDELVVKKLSMVYNVPLFGT